MKYAWLPRWGLLLGMMAGCSQGVPDQNAAVTKANPEPDWAQVQPATTDESAGKVQPFPEDEIVVVDEAASPSKPFPEEGNAE